MDRNQKPMALRNVATRLLITTVSNKQSVTEYVPECH